MRNASGQQCKEKMSGSEKSGQQCKEKMRGSEKKK